MARGDDIEERLIKFAVRIIRLCEQLPKTQTGRHISDQLLRSGSSPAANYAEARRAESTRDFVHKLKISLKKLNETRVWLAIVGQSEMLPEQRLQQSSEECTQLCKILSVSIRTSLSKSQP